MASNNLEKFLEYRSLQYAQNGKSWQLGETDARAGHVATFGRLCSRRRRSTTSSTILLNVRIFAYFFL
jgi:hypothetical protein